MVTGSSLEVLESVSCFARLAPEAMQSLLHCVREKSFAKGEIILLEGEPCPGLFVMKSGSVKLYRNSAEGDEQIMRIIHRGGCFECAPLFDKGPNPVSAQALEACSVLLIPAPDFWSIVSAQPQVVLGIVSILSVRLRSLLNMVEDFSFRRVHSRLAKLLLQLSEEDGGGLAVSPSQPLNQQQLACILGCSRQVVNHSLRELIKGGIIRMEGRHIIILQPEALRGISQP